MNINQAGLDLIKQFESFVNHPYNDPATGGEPITIGYGTTIYPNGVKVTMADANISELQASGYLLANLVHYQQGVEGLLTKGISANQFAALVSFAYNLGLGNLKSSTLLKKVNNNPSDETIPAEFAKWTRGNGKIMQGLVTRRKSEADLYCK